MRFLVNSQWVKIIKKCLIFVFMLRNNIRNNFGIKIQMWFMFALKVEKWDFWAILNHCVCLLFDEQNLFDRIMREKEGVNRNAVVFFIVI